MLKTNNICSISTVRKQQAKNNNSQSFQHCPVRVWGQSIHLFERRTATNQTAVCTSLTCVAVKCCFYINTCEITNFNYHYLNKTWLSTNIRMKTYETYMSTVNQCKVPVQYAQHAPINFFMVPEFSLSVGFRKTLRSQFVFFDECLSLQSRTMQSVGNCSCDRGGILTGPRMHGKNNWKWQYLTRPRLHKVCLREYNSIVLCWLSVSKTSIFVITMNDAIHTASRVYSQKSTNMLYTRPAVCKLTAFYLYTRPAMCIGKMQSTCKRPADIWRHLTLQNSYC